MSVHPCLTFERLDRNTQTSSKSFNDLPDTFFTKAPGSQRYYKKISSDENDSFRFLVGVTII